MYFCNIVTWSRLYQFIALKDSIEQQIKHYEIFVLCMDEDVLRILSNKNFKHVHTIHLSELEDEALKTLKPTRTISEYCWTLKPVFMLYLLKQYDFIYRLTYLDADMYFFNNPSCIFEKEKNSTILLSRHDFSEKLKHMEKDVGSFNSGIISIKNETAGISCLEWWKIKCLDWCYNTTITGQFGDQKYLEDMYAFHKNVSVIKTPGVNIAPWNESGRRFTKKRGRFFIDDSPLILYHYCGFRLKSKTSCIFMFGNTYKPAIHNPYMKAMSNAILQVQLIEPGFNGCYAEEDSYEKFNVFNII